MGKRKSSTGYKSKGERNNVRKDITKAIRRDIKFVDRINNQIDAFIKGKNVVLTIPNPNPNETMKRFIRVNAKDVWKFNNPYMMKQNTSESV
tara:strand:- start:962 stop:1237 length:276 start_codon:yes stop_codon:yes gene_type:complete